MIMDELIFVALPASSRLRWGFEDWTSGLYLRDSVMSSSRFRITCGMEWSGSTLESMLRCSLQA